MACRLPGGIDAERLWEASLSGDGLVTEISPDRWGADAYYAPSRGPDS